ncbi:MAG: hypothetical protein ACJA0Q_002016 [Saprospiraceae bacterium]|jgi:uncharacterized protein (DUF2141 family)
MIKKVAATALILTFLLTSMSFLESEIETEIETKTETTVEKHTITIQVKGFKNSNGQIALALYNNKNQYTDNPWKNFHALKSTAVNGIVTFTLDSIDSGRYAITFLDDENNNKKMDYSFWGLPQEGFGFSNNVKPGFLSAPTYEKCTFDLNTDKNITLNVQYWSE